jgi:hypothetical protein
MKAWLKNKLRKLERLKRESNELILFALQEIRKLNITNKNFFYIQKSCNTKAIYIFAGKEYYIGSIYKVYSWKVAYHWRYLMIRHYVYGEPKPDKDLLLLLKQYYKSKYNYSISNTEALMKFADYQTKSRRFSKEKEKEKEKLEFEKLDLGLIEEFEEFEE